MGFKKIYFLSLILLFYQSQVFASELDYQAISKSLEYSGEMPSHFMQKTNTEYIEKFRETLAKGSWGLTPNKLTQLEANVLIQVADASLRYHKAVDQAIFQSTSEVSLTKAADLLFEKQVAFRKEVIEILIASFHQRKPSYDFLLHHIIYPMEID